MAETLLSKIERLENEINETKEQLKNNSSKYEPQNGEWIVAGSNEVTECAQFISNQYAKIGRGFNTKKKAERARDIMIKHDIILKYVIDHASHYIPDNDYTHGVYYNRDIKEWRHVLVDEDPEIGIVLMPRWVAEKLVDDLNNNRIEGI